MTATVTVDVIDTDRTVLAEGVAGLKDRQLVVTRSDLGWGTAGAKVPLDHPTRLLAVPSVDPADVDYEPSRWLRWRVNGNPAGLSAIERPVFTRLSPDPADQLMDLSGPEGLALLGCRQVDGAVVEGYRGTRKRPWGWIAREWDDSAWWSTTAGFGAYGDDSDGKFIYSQPAPPRFPYGPAERITAVAANSDGAGAVWHDPLEEMWYRYRTPDLGTEDRYKLFFGATNHVWAWLDGQQEVAGSQSGKNSTHKMHEIEFVGDGRSMFAVKLLNGRDQGGPGESNVAWLTWVLYRIDEDGTYDEADPVAWSDPGVGVWTTTRPETLSPWDVIGHPVNGLLPTAQGRGCLPGLSFTATATQDSAGQPWTTPREVFVLDDGTRYADAIRQVVDFFRCDARIDVGAQGVGQTMSWELVVVDDPETDSGVTLVDGQDILTCDVDPQSPQANAARVETGSGCDWVTDDVRIAAEGVRREVPLEFGRYENLEEVEGPVRSVLRRGQAAATQRITSPGLDGAVPLVNYRPGQRVAAPLIGPPVTHYCETVTLDVDDGEGQGKQPQVLFTVDLERRG